MKKILFLILFLINITISFAQNTLTRYDSLSSQIENKAKLILGDSIEVSPYSIVDIERAKNSEYNIGFFDPYNSLSYSVLFDVSPASSENELNSISYGNYYFGIYKNNAIIWLSGAYVADKNSCEGNFLTTKDINSDGKVDILHVWTETDIKGRELGYCLNIISWDGSNGVPINDGGFANPLCRDDYFKVIDINGDNIDEIVTAKNTYDAVLDSLVSEKITYCWNGSLYGEWNNCSEFPSNNTYPSYPFTNANNFEAELNTKVVKNDQTFEYKLNIKNAAESKQKIVYLYFDFAYDSIYYVGPRGNGYGVTGLPYKPICGFTIKSDSLYLSAGQSITYTFRDKHLPKIINCYLQAPYSLFQQLSLDSNEYEDELYKNILINSVKKKSVGPGSFPLQLTNIEFLDTIKTYIATSYSLGWIKNQSTYNKYNTYLTNAKTYLEQEDSSAARSELQLVLNGCLVDSSSVLTSEAFALLYFNTEYLISQLPEEQTFPYLKVNFKDSEGNFILGGSLQYYDSGWKDAADNGDGTFTVQTEKSTVSLKNNYAQTFTQAEKDSIIAALDSSDLLTKIKAVNTIAFNKIFEALPKLEEDIWKQDCVFMEQYFYAINELNSPDIYQISKAILDSAETCMPHEFLTQKPLETKIEATKILFEHDDYSTAQLVFEMFKKPDIHPIVNKVKLLYQIIENVPQLADRAKYYLFKVASDTNKFSFDRYLALNYIVKLYGEEAIPAALNTFKNDHDDANRISSFEYLCQLEYPELHSLIKERVALEPASSYRLMIIDTLLTKYGSPSDYKFVEEFKEIDTNSTNKILLSWKYLGHFKPPQPDTAITTSTMLDTLTSYTNQCYGYEWLKDEAYKTELLNKITNAKTKLNTGDSLGCRTEVASFQNSVNQVYQDSAGSYPKYVSNEGYKFLYYYAQYILDKLPEPVEGLPVKLEDR